MSKKQELPSMTSLLKALADNRPRTCYPEASEELEALERQEEKLQEAFDRNPRVVKLREKINDLRLKERAEHTKRTKTVNKLIDKVRVRGATAAVSAEVAKFLGL